MVADDGYGLVLLHLHAVEDFRVVDDFEAALVVAAELAEDLEDDGDGSGAGDNAGLFGDDRAAGAEAGFDGEGGGDVVGGLVLEEGGFEDGPDALALPIHGVNPKPVGCILW